MFSKYVVTTSDLYSRYLGYGNVGGIFNLKPEVQVVLEQADRRGKI